MMRTSLTLPDELVAELHRRVPRPAERSAVVATALREYFATHPPVASDRDLIDAYADQLNREASEVLEYQVVP